MDIGTINHIRKGHIKVYPEIERIVGSTVYFSDGKHEVFDAIVGCIGFDHRNAEILEVHKSRFDDLERRTDRQTYFGKDGLYFCGFWIGPTGHFKQINSDAQRLAKDIAKKEIAKATSRPSCILKCP